MTLTAAVLAVAALSACASGTHDGTSSGSTTTTRAADATPVIPCGEKAGTSSSGTEDGYRVVLGIVSVPPPVLRQVVHEKSQRWPFWQKAGLAIHPTRNTVSVIVPKAWRKRVALTWGWDHPPASAVKFQACPYGNLGWNGYAGGFYLRKRKECVPLIFKVAGWSKVVRFGFDTSCSGASAPSAIGASRPRSRKQPWMARACRREAAVSRARTFLCPVKGPAGLKPTLNTYRMGLTPLGYMFEGGLFASNGQGQTGHWVFFGWASKRQAESNDPLGRKVGTTSVHDHRASWWRNDNGGGGVLAGHLTLTWHDHGRFYGISEHIGLPFNPHPEAGAGSKQARHLIRSVALHGMRRFTSR